MIMMMCQQQQRRRCCLHRRSQPPSMLSEEQPNNNNNEYSCDRRRRAAEADNAQARLYHHGGVVVELEEEASSASSASASASASPSSSRRCSMSRKSATTARRTAAGGRTSRYGGSALLFLALLAFTYRSEAFASGGGSQHPSLFGVSRGGAAASSTTSSSSSSSSSASASGGPLMANAQGGDNGGEHLDPSMMNLKRPPFAARINKNGKKNGFSSMSTTSRFASAVAAAPSSSSSSSTTATSQNNNNMEVEYVAETKLPTDIGQFQLRAYRVPGAPLGQEPCVIYAREHPPFGQSHVPVRIHDQCLTSEVFRSQRCDCKEQLQMALNYIQTHGGCIIYLQQEGRGIGLANKIAAYALQDHGLDTVDANLHLGFPEDSREYGVVPGILHDLDIDSVELMTNNPRKVDRLTKLGVNVDRTLPMVVPQVNAYNRKYMETKRNRMNHQNLASLLARDPNVPAAISTANGAMAPRKALAGQYINNGTEFTANAVQVSLMLEEEEVEEEGAKAAEDGYCFGRQSVLDAVSAVGRGEMVVVVDDMDRENEGDFIMAADHCTDLDMARIVRYSSGVVCVAMEPDRLDVLEIPPMVTNNQDPKQTAFHVTVDASKGHGTTTGISAFDRAKTVQLLADPSSTPADFTRPGHLFPLQARPGGVLARDGHTEAAVDLSRLAGCNPCGVLCEIVSEENPTEMMRLPELKRFCKRHGFVLTSIVDIAQYRRESGQ